MKSNWEEAKLKSTYHFNKWHKDTDCIEHLGRFTGSWQTELQEVINDTKPLNWSNRREGSGRPDGDVQAEENDLIEAGADVDARCLIGGETPLFEASAEKAKLLIISGADVDHTNDFGKTPIFVGSITI